MLYERISQEGQKYVDPGGSTSTRNAVPPFVGASFDPYRPGRSLRRTEKPPNVHPAGV
jgi:hypothetical protein